MELKARGDEGYIEIPGLGARPAILGRWSIERRGVPGPDGPVWTLRASLSYMNEALMGQPDLPKQIVIMFHATVYDDRNRAVDKKTKRYACVPEEGVTWAVQNMQLLVEGVHLCPLP
jgi:hypothetical protein